MSEEDIEKLVNKFMEDKKINNKELLEKIMLEFCEHIGDYYIILHNVIEKMISYKEKYEAYENLGIEEPEESED